MTIALMRHGQTDWNFAQRVQGRTNIPLNDTGRAQALAAAEAIAAQGTSWQAITSSPLDRARETAEIVAKHLGLPLLDPIEGLIEQNYGAAEGVLVSELETRWPDRNFPDGETAEQLAERGLRTMNELAAAHEGVPVLAVTHGAYVRRIIATVSGIEYYQVPRIANASISTFRKHGEGWITDLINGTPTPEALALHAEVSAHAKAATPAPPITPAPFISLTPLAGDASAAACTIEGVCQ